MCVLGVADSTILAPSTFASFLVLCHREESTKTGLGIEDFLLGCVRNLDVDTRDGLGLIIRENSMIE